jgi:hypothetical protein
MLYDRARSAEETHLVKLIEHIYKQQASKIGDHKFSI